DGDLFRGIVVLGVEIDDRVAKEIHDVQAPADHAGYVVGGKLVASSFPTGGREAATQILAGRLAQRASSFDASIDGSPFFVVLRAIHPEGAPEPIFTGLYISLKTLVDFRNRMRALLLSVAGAAILLSLFTSMLLARGVSRPVHDLVDGTVRVASGEYSHHIDVRSRDELGDLATAFNKMAGDLATKEKIRGVLNKVVAKDVAEELLKGDLGLGGRRMKVSLIFADLRGFTAMSQGMSPEKIVAMLNEHMTAMSAEILACKGIVDKYVGDEIIGVFGAPKSYGDDTLNAVRAAYRMCRRLVALNEERAARGDPPLRMGIGVNTGEVVAGCMGSEEHLNYTCIGENVNLASRLCSNAKAGQILVSEATRADTDPHVEYARLEPIKVKGYEEAIQVYEVMGLQLEDRAAALGS
ncbi:MAG: HAMP domain-containing protein, partial [Planctomycetes bacterium]|nr:HAMP domain-containing protein [Planctomycetota bacterium]